VLTAPQGAAASPVVGAVEPLIVTPPRNETKALSPGRSLNGSVTIAQPPSGLWTDFFLSEARFGWNPGQIGRLRTSLSRSGRCRRYILVAIQAAGQPREPTEAGVKAELDTDPRRRVHRNFSAQRSWGCMATTSSRSSVRQCKAASNTPAVRDALPIHPMMGEFIPSALWSLKPLD
jgi:hypothetical protein